MQTVLLASDRASSPLSAVAPAPLLPVGDRPLAAHAAGAAVDAGATELVFAVGESAGRVQSYFGSRFAGVPVTYAFPDGGGVVPALAAAADCLGQRAGGSERGGVVVLDATRLYDRGGVAALFAHDAAAGVRSGGVGDADSAVSRDVVAAAVPAPLRAAVDGVPRDASLDAVLANVERDAAEVAVGEALAATQPGGLVAATERVLAGAPATPPSALPAGATVTGRVGVAADAAVEADATVAGPALVASGATVGGGAVVRGPAVVGPDAAVERGARVESAVVLERASVAPRAGVLGAVLGPGCSVGADASVAGVAGPTERDAAAVVPDTRPARLRYW